MDARPEDHDHQGLGRNLPCGLCGHDHGPLLCDWCPCGLALRNGID